MNLHRVKEQIHKEKPKIEEKVAVQESRKEEQKVGSVGVDVYQSYFGSIENWPFVVMVFCLVIIGQFSISFTDFFVAQWYDCYSFVLKRLKKKIAKINKYLSDPGSIGKLNTPDIFNPLSSRKNHLNC